MFVIISHELNWIYFPVYAAPLNLCKLHDNAI